MAPQPIEFVLIIYYGKSAHRATYGRLKNTKYTKDYIQLSRKADFLALVSRLFPLTEASGAVALTYHWPSGTTPGAFVFHSADRPHLKWETSLGAPKAWRMTPNPSPTTAETIPGDPSQMAFAAAENELAQLAKRGAGQPYLVAVKLRDEPNKLHLRAYLKNPSSVFAWADLGLVPKDIEELAAKASAESALAWSAVISGGVLPSASAKHALSLLLTKADTTSVVSALDEATARGLSMYLRQPGYGLFFDPTKNHDAWASTSPLSDPVNAAKAAFIAALDKRFPPVADEDISAEALEVDPDEVSVFEDQIDRSNFEVPDSTTTSKTRGSAQRAFSKKVKSNYGSRCAITGIASHDFLIAAHIVPWSEDQSIRLDPSNGICLSPVVDRAFEKGYLLIEDDLTIRIARDRIGNDRELQKHLEPYDGQKLRVPKVSEPKTEYLARRRAIINSSK